MSKRARTTTAEEAKPNKKARVQPKMKTFYVQTAEKENLNNVLSFPHNYLNLVDLSTLSDSCIKGVSKSLETTKLVAITGLSQEDYETEANSWQTEMQKIASDVADLKGEIAGLIKKGEDSEKNIADLKGEIAGLIKKGEDSEKNIADLKGENKDLTQKIEDTRKKMVNQDELIKIITDKITRYESISPLKKK